MRWLALAFTVLVLTVGTALAGSESSQVQKPDQEFKALAQVVAPLSLTDEQLAKIEGQGATLANFNALPPGNPGTSTALVSIPHDVFLDHVKNQWFGRAAGK